MKRILIIMVLGALTACLIPAFAQNDQEWKTANVQGSGSVYAPQVTPVGASAATSEATTTSESYSPAKAPGRPRREESFGDFDRPGDYGQSTESPIGDAMWPLLALVCVYAMYSVARVYKRRRRA